MAMESAEELFARAAAGCVEAQWEINTRLDATNATTPKSENGMVQLKLRKLGERKILHSIPRSMSLVNLGLVELFRKLATGKAPWPLYLHGPAGVGKTRAVLCLCDFVKYAAYATLAECCDIRMAHGPEPWQGGLLGEVLDLFVLDEIGLRLKAGDLEFGIITDVWEHRERYGAGVGVYVSNLTPADLHKLYDDRVCSRLLCGTVFKLDGQDRRLQRKHDGPPVVLPERREKVSMASTRDDWGQPAEGADEYAN
jgi:hypothetical protein